MTWETAEAKQNLSQILRDAAQEPQYIHDQNQPVAAVIGGEMLERFEAWRRERDLQRPLAELFAELRAVCAEEGFEFPQIDRRDRANPFAELTIDE